MGELHDEQTSALESAQSALSQQIQLTTDNLNARVDQVAESVDQKLTDVEVCARVCAHVIFQSSTCLAAQRSSTTSLSLPCKYALPYMLYHTHSLHAAMQSHSLTSSAVSHLRHSSTTNKRRSLQPLPVWARSSVKTCPTRRLT